MSKMVALGTEPQLAILTPQPCLCLAVIVVVTQMGRLRALCTGETTGISPRTQHSYSYDSERFQAGKSSQHGQEKQQHTAAG
jgi:hypothetical protein